MTTMFVIFLFGLKDAELVKGWHGRWVSQHLVTMPLGYWSRIFGCMDSVDGTYLTMDLSGCFLKW